jgi:hypothetical protein
MDQESRRRDAELRKAADYAAMEAALGEPLEAAERRDREARELRKRADELALQVATGDFDLKLGRDCEDNHKSVPKDTSRAEFGRGCRQLMIDILTGPVDAPPRRQP